MNKKDKWIVYRLLTLKKTCNLWINGVLTPTNFNIFTYKKYKLNVYKLLGVIYSVFSRLFLSKYFKRKRGTISSWFQLETAWSCLISTQTSSLQKCSKVWTKINYGVIFKLKQICQIVILEQSIAKLTCLNSRYRDVTKKHRWFFSRCHKKIFFK